MRTNGIIGLHQEYQAMKFDKDAYALTFIKYKRHSTDFGWFVVGVKEKTH